jgi:ABC-type antimicrobial peptide transport system permease subunit
MLTSYIRLALRTLLRNKISFSINLMGMSIALGCCIAAYVNYEFNAGFDHIQVNAGQLYRIGFINESEGKHIPYGVAPMPMGDLIRENIKEVDQVVRYISKDGQFRIGDEIFRKEFVYADPNFTELFTITPLYGSLSLNDKSQVLISDRLAKTYFGTSDVLGKNLSQIISGVPKEFVISGVYQAFPSNSSFRFDLLTTFDNYFTDPAQQDVVEHDWKKWTTTFLYITNPQAVTRIEKQLEQFKKPQNEARQDLQANHFYLESFVGMSKRAQAQRNQGHWFNQPMPPAAVMAPFFMAVFLLLVACFNFTNNAIAVAGNRLKEIGIRKVVGGRRKELIIQFLSETLVFSVIALVIALFLGELFVRGWDAMWPGIELSVRYQDNVPFILTLIGLAIGSALIAGSYPAFYISSFKPIQVLRDKVKFGSTSWLTKSMLVFQFSISLAAVIFALAFYFNSKFQKEFDLGYSYQTVVQVPVENKDQFTRLKNELANNKLIQHVGGSEHHIYGNAYKAPVRTNANNEKETEILNIGDGYFKTVNVRLVEGREFEKDRASDLNEGVIVSEEFMKVFGLQSPIGKRVTIRDTAQYYIVGVVKDVYMRALFQPLAPMVFRYVPEDNYRYLVASTDPSNLVKLNDEIKNSWKKLFPNSLYTGRLMEQDMVMAMEHFDNVVILYTFLGAVAIVMSVSGLFALVSLNLQRRTKELGIRKILGASTWGIALQAGKLFLIVMTVSFVVGSFFGSFMVNKLMDSVWEYYVAIDVRVISFAVIILFTIALLTVSSRIFKVTVTNPAESLRHE